MKSRKLKIGILCAAIAVFFFVLGSFVGWPTQNDKLLGDIGKAKKSSSTVVKIDRDALQEKMLSDTAYCQKTLATVGVMQLHAKQFGALLVMTDAVAKDEKALQSSLEEMQKVKETVKNATAAIDIFADDMVRLSKGEKVNGFEQDYNNAMLGFSMLQRCSNVAVDFAQNVRDSLNFLAEANKKDIETMYAEWVTFAYADALMSQDQLRQMNIEQLFLIRNEDQLGRILPIFKNSGDQLGIQAVLGNSEEQLGIRVRGLNEQLQITGVQNAEQLKAMLLDAQLLNVIIIMNLSSNSENSLGIAAILRDSENSLGVGPLRASILPCVEMLNCVICNQDDMLSLIRDMDVLGVQFTF